MRVWCSDASKATAKTIDLCNHPATKENKLTMAKRIITGSPFYILGRARRRGQGKLSLGKSSFSQGPWGLVVRANTPSTSTAGHALQQRHHLLRLRLASRTADYRESILDHGGEPVHPFFRFHRV